MYLHAGDAPGYGAAIDENLVACCRYEPGTLAGVRLGDGSMRNGRWGVDYEGGSVRLTSTHSMQTHPIIMTAIPPTSTVPTWKDPSQ
jgi:hypothetical protein